MYAIILSFEIKENLEADFCTHWNQLTHFIYKYGGSLGSRLHKSEEGNYIAYALWPDKKAWENSTDLLPEEALTVKKSMHDCCTKISTLSKLVVEDNLLMGDTFKPGRRSIPLHGFLEMAV